LRAASGKTGIFHSRGGYLLRTSQDGIWVPVNLSVSRLHVRPKTLALITARDVREQREADRRLRNLEGELARLTSSISACLWSAEVDGGTRWEYRYWSPVVEKITGRPPAYFQPGPICWGGIVHHDDRAAWGEALARYRKGLSGQKEYRLVWPDGSVRWVREAVAAGRQSPSGPLRLDAVVVDVTDRRVAEEEAREQRNVLVQVLRHIPCAVFWKDRRSVYQGCNEQTARDLGLDAPEQVVGKVDRELASTEAEADFYVRCDHEVMEAGHPVLNIEETQQRPDGQVAFLLTSKVPLRDASGRVTGVLGTYIDITPRKRAEEELRRRESQLAEAQRVAHIGSYEWDLDSGQMTWTDELYRIYGLIPGQGCARDVSLRQCHPEDQDALNAVFQRALADGQPFEYQHRVIRPDGSQRVVRGRGGIVRDPAGRAARLVGTEEDITDRMALEEQLRQAQKMEAVGRLAGGVAHDFNNLLTVINGYGELTLGQLTPGHLAREGVEEMKRAGERAAALTKQLLAFSRQQMLAPRLLDLNVVLEDLERLLRRLIGEDIELITRTEPNLGKVKADPGQIEQVLLNLAVNARDAMPKGGRLTLETRSVELDEVYTRAHPEARPGPYAVVAVSDTGVGMDKATLARIFEPFFTTKEAGKGTGLGLATVYGIVKQSGGHLSVETEPGRGSRFEVYLPRAEEVRRLGKSHQGVRGLPGGTETVLLVEDEEAVRSLTRSVLQRCGYTLLEAPDGVEALAVAQKYGECIDLLVTDVVMPRMGGRELAERLAVPHPAARVLFLSGYTDDAVVRHGVQEAEVAFLQKPFTPSALATKVREVLDSQKAAQRE
jgi:PAS domain S-box-containing protein